LILNDTHPTNQIRLVVWTTKNITLLEMVNNKCRSEVDFWLDRITAGFITEFVVDTTKSYSATNKYFLKGPRGRYIRSGMILGAKFCSWANFPRFFQKRDSLF
jgi:hypothetical protein